MIDTLSETQKLQELLRDYQSLGKHINMLENGCHDKNPDRPKLADFNVLKEIRRTLVGRDFLVQHVQSGKVFLMNYIKKEVFLKTISLDSFLIEKEILEEVKHPFIIGMDYVVSDEDNIYYFLNFVETGPIFHHWVMSS